MENNSPLKIHAQMKLYLDAKLSEHAIKKKATVMCDEQNTNNYESE